MAIYGRRRYRAGERGSEAAAIRAVAFGVAALGVAATLTAVLALA